MDKLASDCTKTSREPGLSKVEKFYLQRGSRIAINIRVRIAQLVSARPSLREIPSWILSDLTSLLRLLPFCVASDGIKYP